MSREILFKAMRIDNGEWVEGQYAYTTNPLTEDGNMYLVLAGLVVRKRGYNCIGDYDDDLKVADYAGGDIVKVYRITPESLRCIEDVFIKGNLELIWGRKEPKKMTIEEMRQKLEELTGEEIEVTA